MTYNRKELAELLNISMDSVKKLDKRNTLEKRLFEYGYKLINKTKKGRNIIYEIESIVDENRVIKNNIYKYVFNVDDVDKFDTYFVYRTENTNKPITKADVSNECEVCIKTVSNWDNSLLDNNIMSKDGFYYMRKDLSTGKIIQTSEEEYLNYWRNRNDMRVLNKIKSKLKDGTIDIDEALAITRQIASLETALSGYYYYKINKFKLHEDNKLYIDISDLIEME